MTADERLESIRLKTKRAKEHIADLEKCIHMLYDGKLYAFTPERDPQTRCPLYRLAKLPTIDLWLSILAGDAIQNLRTSLDHLVQHLYLVNNPYASVNEQISFSIGGNHSAGEYEPELRRKVQGIHPDAVEDLLKIEAYKGGNGHRLWALNALNNADKHRLLLIIDIHPPRFNVGAFMHGQMMASRVFGDAVVPKFDLFVNPAQSDPLKVGDIIHTGAPDAEIEKQIQFSPVIAFSEPGICEGQPILEVLHETTQLVDGVVDAFRPHLAPKP